MEILLEIVNKDLSDCEINLTHDEIKNIPKHKFKEMVKTFIEKASFTNLLEEKNKTSKGRNVEYNEFKMQHYLAPGNQIVINDMRKIFQLKIRDIPVRQNFPKAYNSMICPSSECDINETQQHLLDSNCWINEETAQSVNSNDLKYEDIYSNNVMNQFKVMSVIFQRIAVRDKHLRNE